MVLESLYSVLRSERHPLTLSIMAFIVAFAAMVFAYHYSPESTSALTTILIAIAFIPIIHSIFTKAEDEDVNEHDAPFAFIATHIRVIHSYSWIFVGLVLAFSVYAVVLPETSANCSWLACAIPPKNAVFAEQKKVYASFKGSATGFPSASIVPILYTG